MFFTVAIWTLSLFGISTKRHSSLASGAKRVGFVFFFVVFHVGSVVTPRLVSKLIVTSVWPTTTCSSTAPEQRLGRQIPHSTNKENKTLLKHNQHIISSNSSAKLTERTAGQPIAHLPSQPSPYCCRQPFHDGRGIQKMLQQWTNRPQYRQVQRKMTC